MLSHIARADSTERDLAAPAVPVPVLAELKIPVSGPPRHRDDSLARLSRPRARFAAPPSRATGHSSSGISTRNDVAILNPPRRSFGSSLASAACGRVFQGPNPSSQLRLYSPSSPRPIRLRMKRRRLHPPRPQTPLRSGSSRRPSVPWPRNKERHCPRTQLRRGHRRPTTTIPSRASSRPEEL